MSALLHPSPYLTKALVDVITGGSHTDGKPSVGVYRSAYKIEQFFEECGIAMRLNGESRVPATQAFLGRLAEKSNAGPLMKRLILHVADPRNYLAEPGKAEAVRVYLNRVLEPEGLALSIVNGKAHLAEISSTGAPLHAFTAKLTKLDFDTVQHELERALHSAASDPEDAVTAACSLIEAVCRSILGELSLPLPAKKDIDGLVKAVQEPLGLSPGRTDLSPEVEQDIRQVLGGLTSVAKGIGALRTHGGDAHGREKGAKRLDARIARLAINAASSLALFLIETWERTEKRPLPNRSRVA